MDEPRLIVAQRRHLPILQNLYALYLHDLSPYSTHLDVDAWGRFGTLPPHWFRHPDACFPFLFYLGERPVGFALVAKPPHTQIEAECEIVELFILRGHRRAGLGEALARAVLGRFEEEFALCVLPANRPARDFWRRVLARYGGGEWREEEATLPGLGEAVVFRFANARSA